MNQQNCYIHTAEHYSTIKSNEVHTIKWMCFGNIMLSEEAKHKGHLLYDSTCKKYAE
jgi:hypothetical protein